MDIVTTIFLFLAIGLWAYVQHKARISVNTKIAKELNWTYQVETFEKGLYFFLSKIQKTSRIWSFKGVYKDVKFKLFEIGQQYLGVEFEDDHKFFGFQLVTRDFLDLRMNRWSRELNIANLESNEFRKQFQLFSVGTAQAYYDLDPDSMAALLDLRHKFGALGLEAKAHKVLVYGHYAPYVTLWREQRINKGGMDLETKKQIFLDFLEIAYQINQALK